MDRNVHRPIPTKTGFRRFSAMLSQNDVEYEDIYSIDDELPDFVPSTQTANEPIIPNFPPCTNRENEETFSSTPFEYYPNVLSPNEVQLPSKQSDGQDKPPFIPLSQKARARWSIPDTMVLIEAKRIEKDAISSGGAMKKTTTSVEKWKLVQEYCSRHGVLRTTNQCRDRWEHILPEYKRIRDYESHIPSGHDSYWNMTSRERADKKLPPNFPVELMDAMEIKFGTDRAIDPGNISIDTSEINYTFSQNIPSPNENVDEFDTVNATGQGSQNTDSEREKGYTGKKRKSAFKTTAMKDTIIENNKLVVSTLQVAEEGRMKRHEKDYALMEMRLSDQKLCDEKMFKLEEQKVNDQFKLEEQKLNVQTSLVAALNSIGQAMLKISESFSNEK